MFDLMPPITEDIFRAAAMSTTSFPNCVVNEKDGVPSGVTVEESVAWLPQTSQSCDWTKDINPIESSSKLND